MTYNFDSEKSTREFIVKLHKENKEMITKIPKHLICWWSYKGNEDLIKILRERLILFLRLSSDTRNFYKNLFSVKPHKLDKDNHFSVNLQ